MKALIASAASALVFGVVTGQALSLPGYLSDPAQSADVQPIQKDDPAMAAYKAMADASGPSPMTLVLSTPASEPLVAGTSPPRLEPAVLSAQDALTSSAGAADETTAAARAYAANWTPARWTPPEPRRWDVAAQVEPAQGQAPEPAAVAPVIAAAAPDN